MIGLNTLYWLDNAETDEYPVEASVRMRNALVRVMEVHRPGESPDTPCHDCDEPMPCTTVQAIARELDVKVN